MSSIRSRLASRAGGNIVDQGLSALSNVVLSVVVARAVSPEGFGAFSIAFVSYGIAVALTKALVGHPLQIRLAAETDDRIRSASARGLGFAVMLGLAGSACAVVAWLVVGGPVGQALLALAVVLPALLVQDCCRMVLFTFGRSWSAALIDAVWAVLALGGLAAMVLIGVEAPPAFILCWGGAAAASTVIGLGMLRVAPQLRGWTRWPNDVRGLSGYLALEYIMGLGSLQLGLLVIGAIASVSTVGSLRAAQVLLGPLSVLGVAAFQFMVPEVARRQPMAPRRRLSWALGVSSPLAVITLTYASVLFLVPDRYGVAVLGETWSGAEAVLLPMGVSAMFSAMCIGFAGVLYGMGQAKRTLRINLVKGPILFGTLLLGTWLWGAVGAAWAMAVTEAALLPAWILTLLRSAPPDQDEPAPAPTAGVAHGT